MALNAIIHDKDGNTIEIQQDDSGYAAMIITPAGGSQVAFKLSSESMQKLGRAIQAAKLLIDSAA